MKFILTKIQFDFLITLDNVNNFILKHSFENNNAIFFVDDCGDPKKLDLKA